MADSQLSFDEVAVMLSKQMRAVDTGRANLDVAESQANLAGKLIKIWALELASAMFVRNGGSLPVKFGVLKQKVAIAE